MDRDIGIEVEDASKTLKFEKTEIKKVDTVSDLLNDPGMIPADGRRVKVPELATLLRQILDKNTSVSNE